MSTKSTTEPARPLWLWWNLLSLDAPVVAVVWQDFLARCYPSFLRPTGRWMLGLTVWAIYLGDRLLDARFPHPDGKLALHAFYRKNARFAGALLAIALAADLAIGLQGLRPRVLAGGLWLAAGVEIYLLAFPVAGRIAEPWKPAAAALLFTVGVFLVASTNLPPRTIVWPATAFSGLCFGNMILIGRWEAQERRPYLCAAGLTALAVVAAAGFSTWHFAVSISAASLALLGFTGRNFSSNARRVLADAVLLIPLLFLPWMPIR